MKKAKKILRKYFDADNNIDENAIITAMKEFAIEVAKDSLKNASENAYILITRGAGYCHREISKRSIMDENNIPKL